MVLLSESIHFVNSPSFKQFKKLKNNSGKILCFIVNTAHEKTNNELILLICLFKVY